MEQGPQIDDEQMNKILGLIKSGVKDGAKLLVGGDRVGDRGYFVKPTVFANVEDHHTIAREEVCIACFSRLSHVILYLFYIDFWTSTTNIQI